MPSSAFLGRQEPVFQWAFYVLIDKIGPLYLYVATAALPSVTWETAESAFFSTTRKYASRFTMNEMSVTIKDYVTSATAAQVWNWWLLVGNPQAGDVNSPATYKSDGELWSCNGRGEPVDKWKLEDCFPSAVEFGDLDYSGTDIIQINVTVTIDMAYRM
jgi:hypothetical protein